MKKEQESKIVSIPNELCSQIEERIKATSFDSVDEYVIFVLKEILKEEAEEEIDLSREQEEDIRKRLRILGYLD
ncbi:CopG family transcriptional regulator [Chloroflexota bacterium]